MNLETELSEFETYWAEYCERLRAARKADVREDAAWDADHKFWAMEGWLARAAKAR